MKRSSWLLAFAMVLSTGLPAHAGPPDDKQVIGFSLGWIGWVASRWVPVPPWDFHGVDAECGFMTVVKPNGRVDVYYGGIATASWASATVATPTSTFIECQVLNGAGNVQATPATMGAGAAVVHGTAFDWPAGGITICVRAVVQYSSGHVADSTRSCQPPILL